MSYFAVLDENNVVINLIVAESLEFATEFTQSTCIEYQTPKIGDTYVDGAFISPVIEE